jgi:DNA-binding NarL/FixJ family response regulator
MDQAYSHGKARASIRRGTARNTASDALTSAELLILQRLIAGQRNREIAGTLCISVKTVEYHIHHIFRKLGVHSRTEAVVEGIRRHLVTIEGEQPEDR